MDEFDTAGYELFFQPHAGSRLVSFGFSPTLDDVPIRVMELDGTLWDLVYHDEIDRTAIYNRSAEAVVVVGAA